VADPVASPLQAILVCDIGEATRAAGSEIVKICVAVQELESVTVTVYVPAANPVAVAAVPPEGDQEYVYEPVPPLTLTVAEPLVPPLQETLICAEAEVTRAAGCMIVKLCVAVHEFASVTVTV